MDKLAEQLGRLYASRAFGLIDEAEYLEKMAAFKLKAVGKVRDVPVPFFNTSSKPLTRSQYKPSVLSSTVSDFRRYSDSIKPRVESVKADLAAMKPSAGPQIKFDPEDIRKLDIDAHGVSRTSIKPKGNEMIGTPETRKVETPAPEVPAQTTAPDPAPQPQQSAAPAQSFFSPWQILGGVGAGTYLGTQLAGPNDPQYGYPRFQNSWM